MWDVSFKTSSLRIYKNVDVYYICVLNFFGDPCKQEAIYNITYMYMKKFRSSNWDISKSLTRITCSSKIYCSMQFQNVGQCNIPQIHHSVYLGYVFIKFMFSPLSHCVLCSMSSHLPATQAEAAVTGVPGGAATCTHHCTQGAGRLLPGTQMGLPQLG